jgi:hypothetical protein
MAERFGRRVYSVTYRHADGRDYRHKFGPGVQLAARNGRAQLVGATVADFRDGGTVKKFLDNPPRGRRPWPIYAVRDLDGHKKWFHTKQAALANMRRRNSGGRREGLVLIVQRSADDNGLILASSYSGRVNLHNPAGVHAARSRRVHATRRHMKKRNAKARGVPAWVRARGFTTWASYFQSIQGGKSMKKRRAKRGGGRRRRRAASAAPRHNPRRGRRRYRHNPAFSMKGIMGDVTQLAIGGARDGLVGTASLAGARIVRGKLLNLEGNTIPGIAAELALGLVQAVILKKIFGADVARAAIQGVTQGVVTTAVKGAGIPFLSPGLGDEGELPLLSGIYDLSGVYDLSGGDELPLLTGGGEVRQGVVNVGADADLM